MNPASKGFPKPTVPDQENNSCLCSLIAADPRAGDYGTATAPPATAISCEYYLMIRSPSGSSEVPSYNKHILPLDPGLQFRTNSTIDMLDEHQVAAIENVLNERNARTLDTGKWVLSALGMTEGSSFQFMISFRHYGLPLDFRRTYPRAEAVDGKEKKVDADQRNPRRGWVEAESSIPGPVPATPRTSDQFPNFLKNFNSEDSELASTVGPRSATPGSEIDSRSSTPVPEETRTRTDINMDELDGIENLACKALEYLPNESRMHPDRSKAIDILSRVLDARKKLVGKGHPKVLLTVIHLAYNGHAESGYSRFGPAGRVMTIQDAYCGLKKVFGEKHPHTLMALHALAAANERCGQYKTAVRNFGDALKGRADVLGKTHENTLDTMNRLARVCDTLGWQECAKEAVESLFNCQMENLGKTHKTTLETMEHLAKIYFRDNLWGKAEECIMSLLEHRKEVPAQRDQFVVSSLCFLADIRLKRL